jgi:hypothetical protein
MEECIKSLLKVTHLRHPTHESPFYFALVPFSHLCSPRKIVRIGVCDVLRDLYFFFLFFVFFLRIALRIAAFSEI